MDLRTPLGKVRGLGSAKDGTDHFWKQRLTSIANVPLIGYFVFFLINNNGKSYEEVTSALSNPITAAIVALMVVVGLLHMKLGMQTVIEDYVHSEGNKITLVILNIFFTTLIGAISLLAIIKLALGG